MTDELREGVVFAARFEWATQRFVRSVAGKLESFELGELEQLPRDVTPLPNPARVREYWADVMPPGTKPWDYPAHWCGALCLFSIHRAGLAVDEFWESDGFEGRVLRQLRVGEVPKPGDVAYFLKHQHRCVVERVDEAAGTFDSIDGNQSPGIQRKTRPLTSAYAFYSLDPLLAAER